MSTFCGAWCYPFSLVMTPHKLIKKKYYEYTIFYRIAELIYSGFLVNTGIPSCMNKSGGSILELPSSMPADVSSVAPKETDYIAFESQAFDASGVGFYEILMVDHLKSIWFSFSCTSFAFDSSISIRLKRTSFDFLLPTTSLSFLDLKLYFFYCFCFLSPNFPLSSHW